jgi:hypothetical protein
LSLLHDDVRGIVPGLVSPAIAGRFSHATLDIGLDLLAGVATPLWLLAFTTSRQELSVQTSITAMGAPEVDEGELHARKVGNKEMDAKFVDQEEQLPNYGQERRALEGEILDERYETTQRGLLHFP